LKKNEYVLHREEWIDEAIVAEMSGCPLTCKGIIYCVLGEGIPELDKKRIWLEDLEALALRNSMTCARAAYELLLEKFNYSEDLILKALEIENKYGVKAA
jgi:pre-mRNA-processing factor 6